MGNHNLSQILALETRWSGLWGGVATGIVDTLLYRLTGDKVSLSIAIQAICLFSLAGYMLGLLFQLCRPDPSSNYRSFKFIGGCTFLGAIVIGCLGPFFAKSLTDDCFKAHENCRQYVGNAEFCLGSIILAFSISGVCYVLEMRQAKKSWLWAFINASLIAIFVSVVSVGLLDILNVGPQFFDIDNPYVSPHSVMVGGAILGSVTGALVGFHAALMVAFARDVVPTNKTTQESANLARQNDAKAEKSEELSHGHVDSTGHGQFKSHSSTGSISESIKENEVLEETQLSLATGEWLKKLVTISWVKKMTGLSTVKKNEYKIKHSNRDSAIVASIVIGLIVTFSLKKELIDEIVEMAKALLHSHESTLKPPNATQNEENVGPGNRLMRILPGFTGIVIAQMAGSTDSSLQRNLAGALNKISSDGHHSRCPITVRIVDEVIDDRNGMENANEAARELGRSLNASIVVWGSQIKDDAFYLRISLTETNLGIEQNVGFSGPAAEQQLAYQVLTEKGLPRDSIIEPYWLATFFSGLICFSKQDFTEALDSFKEACGLGTTNAIENADANLFAGLCQSLSE